MTCDAYYDEHPPYTGDGDPCSLDEIAAGTATQFSIVGISTTFCGTLNLFLAGWLSKKVGPRTALLAQIYVPAIRVVAQIMGVVAGKKTGMLIIQCTQLITVFGGPVGYMYVILVGGISIARVKAHVEQMHGVDNLGHGYRAQRRDLFYANSLLVSW